MGRTVGLDSPLLQDLRSFSDSQTQAQEKKSVEKLEDAKAAADIQAEKWQMLVTRLVKAGDMAVLQMRGLRLVCGLVSCY